jgi:hypothetical protein
MPSAIRAARRISIGEVSGTNPPLRSRSRRSTGHGLGRLDHRPALAFPTLDLRTERTREVHDTIAEVQRQTGPHRLLGDAGMGVAVRVERV